MGVAVRRYIYIDFLIHVILLIPTPLALALFCSSIPTSLFLFYLNGFSFFKKKECQMAIFLTSRGAYVNCAIMAMLYTHLIGNQL